ncbi:WhiB family transcriptional regulator [Catenulispora pinistramenti]|nr:WhiB family transcriptional regulator [Catenulispora pinistramenti]
MTTMTAQPRLAALIGELPAWMSYGACRDEDPDLFFGTDPGFGCYGERKAARVAREKAAKAVCAACPVRESCLEFAMATPEHDGVWGGLTDKERRRMRRATLRKPTPST